MNEYQPYSSTLTQICTKTSYCETSLHLFVFFIDKKCSM